MSIILELFGGDAPLKELEVHQIAARALAVYFFGLAIVRVGKSRLMSNSTPIDVLLVIILGSLLSRAITGSASLTETFVSCAVLVAMHALITVLTYYWHPVGNLLKGHVRPLVKDGVILWDQMRQSHYSEHDLKAAIRLQAGLEDVADVSVAMKERSGEISVVPKQAQPHIIEIAVQEGVQQVRIEWVR